MLKCWVQAGPPPLPVCRRLVSPLLPAPQPAYAGENKPGHTEHAPPTPPQPPRIKGPRGFSLCSCSNKGSSVPRHGRRADGANWVSAKGLSSSACTHEPTGCPAPAGAASGSSTTARDVIRAGSRWGISLSSHCLLLPCLSLGGQGWSAPGHGGLRCPLCLSSSGLHQPPSWEMRARHERGEQTQRRSPAQWD